MKKLEFSRHLNLLREEDSLVADAAALQLPAILYFSRVMVPIPVPGKMGRAVNKSCHAGRI